MVLNNLVSDPINQSIVTRLSRLARSLRRRVAHERGRISDLTVLQMQALMHIRRHPGLKMSELSEALGISASSASLLFDRLVAGGWLERVHDEEDRRVVYVRLTPHIRRHFRHSMSAKLGRLEQLLDVLSEEDRRDLDRILANLEASL